MAVTDKDVVDGIAFDMTIYLLRICLNLTI